MAGIRHWFLPRFATRFQEAGFAVLLYDNRNWGDSDGEPRHESNPFLQQTDYHDAFNYAVTLPGVDPERIAYWGTSFSGGNVVYAAAIDKRIKAAIAQAPSVSGETRSIAFKDRIPALFDDRARIAAGAKRGTVPCIASNADDARAGTATALFPDIHAYEAYSKIYESGGRWDNWITEQTQLHMLKFEPQSMIHRISPTPFLMVIPGNDMTVKTSGQLEAFGKAREPKQMLFLDQASHFDIYEGECFERNIAIQIEFLKKHLSL